MYVATKVRDLIEQHTLERAVGEQSGSAISSVHKSNPLRQTNNVLTNSEYPNNQEKSIENNKKLTIQGEKNMSFKCILENGKKHIDLKS